MVRAGQWIAVFAMYVVASYLIIYHFQIPIYLQQSLWNSSQVVQRRWPGFGLFLWKNKSPSLASPSPTSSSSSSSVPICTSQQRLNYIRQQHRKYNMTSRATAATLVVSDKHRLAYCFTPKCGSSTMKRFMATLTGTAVDFRQLRGSIHTSRRLRQFGLRLVSSKHIHTISDYRKFVVIRNPMDRFLSAFHDKVLQGNSPNGTKLVRFTKTVLNGKRDEHWNPYAARCNFPAVDYDDVIRIETFRNDVSALLTYTHSNFSVLLETSKFHFRRESTKAADVLSEPLIRPKHLQEYSDVSTNDLIKLKHLYKNDLRLFGYEFDVDTLVASCSMTDERGVTCC